MKPCALSFEKSSNPGPIGPTEGSTSRAPATGALVLVSACGPSPTSCGSGDTVKAAPAPSSRRTCGNPRARGSSAARIRSSRVSAWKETGCPAGPIPSLCLRMAGCGQQRPRGLESGRVCLSTDRRPCHLAKPNARGADGCRARRADHVALWAPLRRCCLERMRVDVRGVCV